MLVEVHGWSKAVCGRSEKVIVGIKRCMDGAWIREGGAGMGLAGAWNR